MAKKTTNLRVHQLAKTLGVESRDIVAKCKAEEIPDIKNHMSAVSLGLAETIRSWFGGQQGEAVVTAVEQAAPVDVPQARAKAQRKKKKVGTPVEETSAAVAVAERPSEVVVGSRPIEVESIAPSTSADETEDATVMVAETTVETPMAGDATAAGESTDVEGDEAAPQMNIPERPKVMPAGPMLQQPTKTTLAGPKVIRVEAPDILPSPQSRQSRGGPRGAPRGGQGAGMIPRGPGGPAAGEPPMPQRGGAGAGAGGRSTFSRRNKRRSASARDESGRTARAGQTGAGENRGFNWREQDLLERERRLKRSGGFFKANRRDNQRRAAGGGHRASTARETGGSVHIEEPITVKSLSAATGIKVNEILKKLLLAGQPCTINSVIDSENAHELMTGYGIELAVVEQKTAEEQIVDQFAQREAINEQPRSPVVAILGHVDHGKTSLLDCIRQTNVADGEAGGITQATSAFQVPVTLGEDSRLVTFIDTPGHEAFTEMRARGAKVTDIVVLVVAADDGVMPQTIESISHAKAADVPIVVALNKIDKPEATDNNIQRILGELAEHELNPVEWGGSTEVLRTSAINKEGIQELLEILDYQAQLLEMTADMEGPAEGTVIESRMEEGRGPVASVLVQEGQLRKGDFVAVGRAFGRVRDIVNDHGQRIDEAGPSMPVVFSGISEIPDAGDKFYIVKSLKAAEAAAEERRNYDRERELATEKITLDNIFSKLAENERKELPLIVKADVQGSVETLKATLEKISTDDVTISIKHMGVGGITESDILLGETTGAILVGFNVTTSSKARKLADAKGIDIRLYEVIYDLTDDVTNAAEGLLDPEYKLEVIGHAEVREVFKVSKVGMIAGCYVTDGNIERNAQIRVTRGGIVVESDRRLEQLKRFKDDAKEVRSGQECGMRIDGYDDIKVGDVLECYKTREVRRTLT